MEPDKVSPAIQVMAYGNCLKITDELFGHAAGRLPRKKPIARLKQELHPAGAEPGITEMNIEEPLTESVDEKNGFVTFLKQSKAPAPNYDKDILTINSLFKKDPKVFQHCIRVSEISEAIAGEMGFNPGTVKLIKTAGLVHDIGKIGVSEAILNKPGKLDEQEWLQIKQHSEIGCRILSSLSNFSKIAGIILQHHERWDGTGYPNGLSGRDISLEARIIAVADAYDAMTSTRSYKEAVSVEKAVMEILSNAGSQFDPEVAAVFIEKVIQPRFKKAAENSLVYAAY